MAVYDSLQICVLCDQGKRSGTNSRQAGGFVCIACYKRELAPRHACSQCGTVAPVSAWVGGRRIGRAYCILCYANFVHVARCSVCRKRKSIHTRASGTRPVCVDCYTLVIRAKSRCEECGRLSRVYSRDASGAPCCRACHLRKTEPTESCLVCGERGHVAARREGRPICTRCYKQETKAPCAYCERTMTVARRTKAGKAVCSSCAYHRMTTVQTCDGCRQPKRTRRRTAAGKPLCDSCYMMRRREAGG